MGLGVLSLVYLQVNSIVPRDVLFCTWYVLSSVVLSGWERWRP